MADTNVLQFMVVRAPVDDGGEIAERTRILDCTFGTGGRADRDLFSSASTSEIGRTVYTAVFCTPPATPPVSLGTQIRTFVDDLVGNLPALDPTCPEPPSDPGMELLAHRSTVLRGTKFHLVPREFEGMADETAGPVRTLAARLLPEAAPERENVALDVAALTAELCTLLTVTTLDKAVFDGPAYATWFAAARTALFDRLYLLYILRRSVGVDLDPIMDGLRALHALEALAVDALVARLATTKKITAADRPLVDALATIHPALASWDAKTAADGFPAVGTRAVLADLLSATPIVHPLFARLHRFRQPFNDVTPVGVGDLKVVKQRLLAYHPGEIARIDNVMKSEYRSRSHRVLDRSEDVFTSSSEESTETQRDTQTTDRFELKQEADRVVKTDTALNAGLNVSTTVNGAGYSVVAGVTGGFSQTRSQTDNTKIANTFARDVIDKAVKRVQSKSSRSRTTTTTFETEDTDRHTFDNAEGEDHVTGIYRWVDKEYESQVYNYGKRMMFEFVLPEPAAFYVESRLRGFQSQLTVPQPPAVPDEITLPAELVALAPAEIDETMFARLEQAYDLSAFAFPARSKTATLVNPENGQVLFTEHGIELDDEWYAKSFTCTLPVKGYEITTLKFDGSLFWREQNEIDWRDQNLVKLSIDGTDLWGDAYEHTKYLALFSPNDDIAPKTASQRYLLTDDTFTLTLGFQDIVRYSMVVSLDLALSPGALLDWQERVLAHVRGIEQARVDADNNDLRQSYQSQMSAYRNRLAQVEAIAVNDLLAGRSEAANRQVVIQELKRQCLAVLTREFDADDTDDVLTDVDATGERAIEFSYRRLDVKQEPNATTPTSTSVDYVVDRALAKYPMPDLATSREKGRFIQFLEQAFEWHQLSWVCYPYFWAATPEWVQLMNREDPTDPFFNEFLQAGSVRVLLAVTPAFGDAVLHYLATGEPWDGGPAPVIGDPLHIPLHEELRKQQDDLDGAEPEGEPWRFTLPTSLLWLQADGELNPVGGTGNGGSSEPVAGLWTGTAHQDTLATLPSNQKAWTNWPPAATWQVDVPDWATDVDVNFVLNPSVVGGSVWGELRLVIDGEETAPTMFDVNYTADPGHFPEQSVMIVGGTRAVPSTSRGKRVTVTMQAHMLDPSVAPGRLAADRGCYVNGQLNFKRHAG